MHPYRTHRVIRSSVSAAVLLGMVSSKPGLALAFEPTQAPVEQPDVEDASSNAETNASRAAELVEQGTQAYESEDLEGAIRLFEQAYELDPKPNLVFNIGRVYEELGDLQRAIDFYSRFTVQAGIRLETRQLAAERIRVLRDILSQSQQPEPAPEPTAAPAEPGPPPPGEWTPSADAGSEEPMDVTTPPVDRGRGLRIAGYTLLGVGLGAGAAALGLGVSGLNSEKQAERSCAPLCQPSEIDTIRQQLLAADVLGGLTGALLATSVVLMIVGIKRDETRERKLSARVTPSPLGLRVRW